MKLTLDKVAAALPFQNPYKATSGPELDEWVHRNLFGEQGSAIPSYSTDERAAEKVRARIKALYGHRVQTGTTKLRNTPFFARIESGPSTSTETLAESLPLALCRLALVAWSRRGMGD